MGVVLGPEGEQCLPGAQGQQEEESLCAVSVGFLLSTPDLEQTQVGASSPKPSTALVLWVPSVFSHIVFHSLVQDKIPQGTLSSLGLLLPREVLTVRKATG